jgi:hypothetical protein
MRGAWLLVSTTTMGLLAATAGCGRATPTPGAVTAATPVPAPSAPAQQASPTPEATAAAPAASASAATQAPTFGLPPLYASLFELGRTLELRITSTTSRVEENKTVRGRSVTRGTCRVAEAGAHAGAFTSTVACEGVDANGVRDPLSGRWVATARGLFRLGDEDDPSQAPSDDELVIAASPAPIKTRREAPEDHSGDEYVVKAKGRGYCATRSSWGGDEGWTSLCFEPGMGVRSGTWGGGVYARERVRHPALTWIITIGGPRYRRSRALRIRARRPPRAERLWRMGEGDGFVGRLALCPAVGLTESRVMSPPLQTPTSPMILAAYAHRRDPLAESSHLRLQSWKLEPAPYDQPCSSRRS